MEGNTNNERPLSEAMARQEVPSNPDDVVRTMKYISGDDVIVDQREIEQMKNAVANEQTDEVVYVTQEDIEENGESNKEIENAAKSKLEKLNNALELQGLEKAGKKTRKKMYTEETPIISIGDSLEITTESESAKQALIELSASMKSKKPLTAIIDGTDFIGKVPCAIIFYNIFKIIIPYSEMNISEPEEIKGTQKNQETYRKMLLDMRIGSEIDFIVKGIDEKQGIVMASRKDAMVLMKRTYYTIKNKSTGMYAINEGARVEARVTHITSWGIGVEIFGLECFIKVNELSYRRIPSVLEEFYSGDKIVVRITKLVREMVIGNDGKKKIRLQATASVKQAKNDQRLHYFNEYNIGSKYRGIVTQVTEDGIFVRLGGVNGQMDCMCAFPKRGKTPPKGSIALVHVSDKQEENLFIYGSIVRWTPSRL